MLLMNVRSQSRQLKIGRDENIQETLKMAIFSLISAQNYQSSNFSSSASQQHSVCDDWACHQQLSCFRTTTILIISYEIPSGDIQPLMLMRLLFLLFKRQCPVQLVNPCSDPFAKRVYCFQSNSVVSMVSLLSWKWTIVASRRILIKQWQQLVNRFQVRMDSH